MYTQKVNFQHEVKVESDESDLLNYEDIGKEITKPNTEKSSSEFSEKQILYEYFIPESIKQEETGIKSEEEEEVGQDQFSTDEFNEKQMQDDCFDSKSIKQEEIEIKTENEEGDQFSTEPSTVESKKELHPTNKAARLNKLSRKNTKNHRANVEEPPLFKCFRCSYETHEKLNISRHILSHMPKTSFECTLCPYKCNSTYLLKKHKVVHISKEDKLHKCPQCTFTSRWKQVLSRHSLTHKKPDEITWYQCPQCPYKTKHMHYLQKRHIPTHRNDQPMHKCTLCSYESFSKDNLQVHLCRVHKLKDLPLISCPEEECSFKTTHKLNLQCHIKRMHQGQKIFKCSQCLFRTRYVDNFKAHQLKHQNPDGWLSCPLCPYKTTRKFSLNDHALVHKNDTEIEWHQCSKCTFRTKRWEALRRHYLNHNPEAKKVTKWFYCHVCTWRTAHKWSLTYHLRNKHRVIV